MPAMGIRTRIVDALRAGEAAGRDPTVEPTACPYEDDLERRTWIRGYARGRILGRLPTPSEVGEEVDETSDVDPARRDVPRPRTR